MVDTGTAGTRRSRRWLGSCFGLVLALPLAACGGEGTGDRPSPTASLTATSLPSRTASLPSPTRSRSRGEPATTTPPSRSNSPSPSAPPSASATRGATTASSPPETTRAGPPGSASAIPSPSASASPSDAPQQADADTGVATWVWWVLVGVLLAAALAALLVPRARRRRAWRADLAAAEGEAAWFARELLPQLQQAGSADEVAGGWRVASGRVTAVEDQLTRLEPTAPDEAGRGRARELRDAVRVARSGVEGLVASRDPAAVAHELGALAIELAAAVEPAGRTSPPAQ